jgi:ABC-type uncharacterized transport system permease subunit
MDLDFLSLFFATLRGATPLVLAAYAGLLSERSGVIQIGLEGKMLLGALSGAVVALQFGSAELGFLTSGIVGALLGLFFGLFAVVLRTDQIILGTAINILAVGAAPFVTKLLYDSTGSTPSLSIDHRFQYEPMVFAAGIVMLISYWFHRTKSGLIVQFAGESPLALASAGYSVAKTRLLSLVFCGALAGFAGGSLSLFLSSAYSPNMSAGRGFIALAALIFGRWKPIPTALACLFFAFFDALQIQLQGSGLPVQFIQVLPYLVTIFVLAGFFGRSKAPKALGTHEGLT